MKYIHILLIHLCLVGFLFAGWTPVDTLSVTGAVQLYQSTQFTVNWGNSPLVRDAAGRYHLAWDARGDVNDYIFYRYSDAGGATWSPVDTAFTYSHGDASTPQYQRYHLYDLNLRVDNTGKAHIISNGQGFPNYISGWDAYPSAHVSYATNESGAWQGAWNVLDDHPIQESEGNGNTVCYLSYLGFWIDSSRIKYLTSIDVAWWATHYHVVYSEKTGSDPWSVPTAFYTYNRGAIDRTTVIASDIAGHDDQVLVSFYNRYTGQWLVREKQNGVWGGDQVILQSSPATDGTASVRYARHAVYTNSGYHLVLYRREGSIGVNRLYYAHRPDGASWQVDSLNLDLSDDYQIIDLDFVFANNHPAVAMIMYDATNGDYHPYLYEMDTAGNAGVLHALPLTGGEVLALATTGADASHLAWYAYQADSGTYSVWFAAVGGVTGMGETRPAVQQTFRLQPNFPNPFNPATTIGYQLPSAGKVSLDIYNILGEKIKRLVAERQAAGVHKVVWDGRDDAGHPMPSGIYFYRLVFGNRVEQRQMILLK